jgi:hypothetical protein
MGRRWDLSIMFAFAALLLCGEVAQATSSYKQVCLLRCRLHLQLCLTPSNLSSRNADEEEQTTCNDSCVETLFPCRDQCATITSPSKRADCNGECTAGLSTCARGCSESKQACNATDLACENGCNAIPDCTPANAGTCGFGNVCFQNRCMIACKTNQDCKTLMRSTDAVCQSAGPAKGQCFLY